MMELHEKTLVRYADNMRFILDLLSQAMAPLMSEDNRMRLMIDLLEHDDKRPAVMEVATVFRTIANMQTDTENGYSKTTSKDLKKFTPLAVPKARAEQKLKQPSTEVCGNCCSENEVDTVLFKCIHCSSEFEVSCNACSRHEKEGPGICASCDKGSNFIEFDEEATPKKEARYSIEEIKAYMSSILVTPDAPENECLQRAIARLEQYDGLQGSTAGTAKLFMVMWGSGYEPCKDGTMPFENHHQSYFTTDIGFPEEDIDRIDELELGNRMRCEDLHECWVTRIR